MEFFVELFMLIPSNDAKHTSVVVWQLGVNESRIRDWNLHWTMARAVCLFVYWNLYFFCTFRIEHLCDKKMKKINPYSANGEYGEFLIMPADGRRDLIGSLKG